MHVSRGYGIFQSGTANVKDRSWLLKQSRMCPFSKRSYEEWKYILS